MLEQDLYEIGLRLKRYRLNQNLSQKEIAERAGIGLNSVVRLEDGKGSTLANFIRVMHALNASDGLDSFLPEPPVSPIRLSELQGRIRRKASRKK